METPRRSTCCSCDTRERAKAAGWGRVLEGLRSRRVVYCYCLNGKDGVPPPSTWMVSRWGSNFPPRHHAYQHAGKVDGLLVYNFIVTWQRWGQG